jgi:5-methylcytosine-specific restriction endonuclease McrA
MYNNGFDEKEARKLLSRRAFNDKDKKAQYERQRHVCPHCLKRFNDISMMAGDHIVPYNPIPSSGQISGPTLPENLQMLCHSCNLEKSNHPFDKATEEKGLQNLYSLTDEEVNSLPEATLN